MKKLITIFCLCMALISSCQISRAYYPKYSDFVKLNKTAFINFSGFDEIQGKISIFKDSITYDTMSKSGDIFPKKHYRFLRSFTDTYDKDFGLISFKNSNNFDVGDFLIITRYTYVFINVHEFEQPKFFMRVISK